MAGNPQYVCTNCGKSSQRDLLTVKKTVFLEMGMGGRTIRSRVVGWLCPSCVARDAAWNQEKFVPLVAELKPLKQAVNG